MKEAFLQFHSLSRFQKKLCLSQCSPHHYPKPQASRLPKYLLVVGRERLFCASQNHEKKIKVCLRIPVQKINKTVGVDLVALPSPVGVVNLAPTAVNQVGGSLSL